MIDAFFEKYGRYLDMSDIGFLGVGFDWAMRRYADKPGSFDIARKEFSNLKDDNDDGIVQQHELLALGDPVLALSTKLLKQNFYSPTTYPHISNSNSLHIVLGSEYRLAKAPEIVRTYALVNDIIKELKEKMNTADPPAYQLQKLDGIIKRHVACGGDVALLSKGLGSDPAVLDCDTLSALYLCVAEEMKWPLAMVDAPEHIYVVWDKKDGTKPFYWETTNGTVRSLGPRDSHLDRSGFFSQLYANRGLYLSSKNDTQESNQRGVEEFTKAIALNPKSNHAFYNRAVCYLRLKKDDLARKDFKEAVRLDKHDEAAWGKLRELEQHLR